MNDLTTSDGIRVYLADTVFASHAVVTLGGGTANYTYRIHLIEPFDGQKTFVLKHAEPFVKNTTMQFSLERQMFEYEAMTRVKAWLPADSVVTVPTIYKFDKEQHVLIIEDCGTDALTLKDFMLKHGIDGSTTLAAAIGSSLGSFIAGMHAWSRSNPDGILDLFTSNTQAFRLSAWATYGRLVQTLKPGASDDVLPALVDAPLAVSDADLEVTKRVAAEVQASMLAAREYFVMGDFWPGNIMIVLDGDGNLRKVYLLDWELAKLGVPGVEIGQFCAEVHLVRRYVPSAEQFTSTILNTFLSAYASGKPDIQVARNTLVHWGTHLVVWTPRVATWAGDKDKARNVVEEGVQLIVTAADAGAEELTSSFVGPLVRS